MSDYRYAETDDFQKAAARVLKFANDSIQDAQSRLASEGFFKRAKLARIFEPSLKMCRAFVAPANVIGASIFRDPDAAKAYCLSVSDLITEHTRAVMDGDPGSRRLVFTIIGHMMETTAEVLTKRSHDQCWYGSEGLADELRSIFDTSPV